jgi:hypothetical protein
VVSWYGGASSWLGSGAVVRFGRRGRGVEPRGVQVQAQSQGIERPRWGSPPSKPAQLAHSPCLVCVVGGDRGCGMAGHERDPSSADDAFVVVVASASPERGGIPSPLAIANSPATVANNNPPPTRYREWDLSWGVTPLRPLFRSQGTVNGGGRASIIVRVVCGGEEAKLLREDIYFFLTAQLPSLGDKDKA